MTKSPLRDFVLIEVQEQEQTTKSGIFLPNKTKDEVRAKVLAVGPKVEELKEGDLIIMNLNHSIKIEDSYVICEKDVYCKILN